jgi:hypothetical protein
MTGKNLLYPGLATFPELFAHCKVNDFLLEYVYFYPFIDQQPAKEAIDQGAGRHHGLQSTVKPRTPAVRIIITNTMSAIMEKSNILTMDCW